MYNHELPHVSSPAVQGQLTGRPPGLSYEVTTLRHAMRFVQNSISSRDLGATFLADWAIFEVATLAHSKEEFLLQPGLGRSLSAPGRVELAHRCPRAVEIQVAIADGLSAAAVRAQVPTLLPLISAEVHCRGWRFGQPFFIRHGRVGILNEIGEILDPTVAVLLIGERPGLATAESLSAYMAYRPRVGHDDAPGTLFPIFTHTVSLPNRQLTEYANWLLA